MTIIEYQVPKGIQVFLFMPLIRAITIHLYHILFTYAQQSHNDAYAHECKCIYLYARLVSVAHKYQTVLSEIARAVSIMECSIHTDVYIRVKR